MISELTLQESADYNMVLCMAKQEAEASAVIAQGAYIDRATKKLESEGLSPKEARAAVEMRLGARTDRGTLHPRDKLCFQKDGEVLVETILAEPKRYHMQYCADPTEPEEGNSRACLFANREGSVILFSQLHGGQNFYLRRAGDKEAQKAEPENWFGEKIKAGGVGRFLDHQPPVLDFVSANSLMAGTVGMLVGPGAVGKTTLANQMAVAVATGRDILPGLFTPTKPGKVLVCAAEDGEAVLHHRFAALADALFTVDSEAQNMLRENLRIISVTGHDLRLIKAVNGSFEITPFYEMVRSTLADITGLRMVLFDPQSRWYGAEENDNGAATFFVSRLEKIAQDTGAAVMVSHHVTKRAGYGVKGEFSLDQAMNQDAARGASGLTNAVRWQMNLFGLPVTEAKKSLGVKDIKPGQYLAATVSKKNYGPPERIHFLERGWGGVFSITAPAEQRMAEDLERIARSLILNAVTACEGRQMTKRTLIDGHLSEWKNTDQRITRPVMEQAVAACIVHMELFEREEKNAQGRNVKYLSRFQEVEITEINKNDMFDTVD